MKHIIIQLIKGLNLIISTFLILSLISPFVNPDPYWIISFFGLFFPIILAIYIVFTIYLIKRNKKIITIISCLLIIISFMYIDRYININKKYDKQDTVRIMSYNVRMFNKYEWIDDNNIKEKIKSLIESQEIDIVCIQEYYNPELDLRMSLTYSHIGIQKQRNKWHMAIYSRFPQIKKETVNILGESMNNTCIYSDIKIKEDTIRVYNIHLASNFFSKENLDFIQSPKLEQQEIKNGIIDISRRLKSSFIKRGKEVIEIKKHINQSPYPVVICGDFNDTPMSYAYHNIRENRKDAFVESGNGLGSSYFKIPFLRIDYIIHDDQMESYNFITHKNKLSDHKAISCDIKIK